MRILIYIDFCGCMTKSGGKKELVMLQFVNTFTMQSKKFYINFHNYEDKNLFCFLSVYCIDMATRASHQLSLH